MPETTKKRRRPSTFHALLVASLVSAACLSPHPDESRPALEDLLRGELREGWTSASSSGNYPAEPFWATFGDQALEDLVAEALEHNYDLVASAERLRGALARSRVARSARSPQLDANTNYARQKNVFVGLPIPGASGGVLANQFSQWSASLDLAWELDLWGRLGASVRAADAEAQATLADLAAARLSIAAQVARAWFGLREATEQLELARRTLATFDESARVVRDRFDAGLTGALDLRLAEANVATSRANLVAAERGEGLAARQIELLVGRFPAAELEASGAFGGLPPEVPAGVPAEVLARRPDLVAAERRMTAAEAAAKVARLERWPTFALTSSIGRTSSEFEDLLDGDFTVWSFAAALAAPILDGGRRRARIRESLAELRGARATFAGLALRAFFEVENALDAERLLRQSLTHLEAASTAAGDATSLADDQYREGLVSIELVLESQRRQLAAESSFLAARRELFQTRVDLHVALGGPFVARGDAEAAPDDPTPEAGASPASAQIGR